MVKTMKLNSEAEALTDKWIDHTLTVEDIMTAVPSLARRDRIDLRIFKDGETKQSHEDGLRSVAKLIHRVYQWSEGINPHSMGGFLTSVVENDFHRAVCNADGTNYKALSVYARYFYNLAPRRWRTQKSE